MAILSRRPILLAILLYEQFLHLTQINLHLNTQLLSTQQHAYQSFKLLPGLIPFASLWHAGWILKKNIYMNMNYSSLTTMYESMVTQMYIFLVEKYFFAILAKTNFHGKQQKL